MKTIDYEMLMNSVAEFGKEKNPNFRLSDDDKNIYSMVLMYFNEDPRFEQISPSYTLKKGLLIRGNVGVGKTMMMKMVLDFLRGVKRIVQSGKTERPINSGFVE